MASLKYTHAVVCRVPKTFGSDLQVDYQKAKQQHEFYVKTLRDTGIDVIELPPDEALPLCGFVEDTAVICNGIALIARPGNVSRQKEVREVAVAKRSPLFVLFLVYFSDRNHESSAQKRIRSSDCRYGR